MLIAPNIDPIAITLGPIAIRWYGLMYLLGFFAAWRLGVARSQKPRSGWSTEEVSDLIFYGAIGVILGGRLGYVLFYNLPHYLGHPLDMFKVWQGGMSFHGGLIGVILAMMYFARGTKKHFFVVADFLAPFVPIGLGTVRIGNFINQELWGRTTDVPWGMVFAHAGPLPRHPSQLYEAALEGIILFTILWFYSAKPRPTGAVAGLFLVGYSVFRIFVEFFREPDENIGYLAADWLTMGQVLSLPMLVFGVFIIIWSYQRRDRT